MNLLPQFQEEENKKFDVLMRKMYISGLLDGREKANTHIRVKDIINGMNTTETATFLQEMDKTLSSSHSRLIDKIVEMIEREKCTGRFSPPFTRETFEGKDSLGYDVITKNIHNSALSLIQSKLKQ